MTILITTKTSYIMMAEGSIITAKDHFAMTPNELKNYIRKCEKEHAILRTKEQSIYVYFGLMDHTKRMYIDTFCLHKKTKFNL